MEEKKSQKSVAARQKYEVVNPSLPPRQPGGGARRGQLASKNEDLDLVMEKEVAPAHATRRSAQL